MYVEESIKIAPDAALLGLEHPVIDIHNFYRNMNSVFEKIENWTNLKIIIAASGKYHYEINPFNNRPIIYKNIKSY